MILIPAVDIKGGKSVRLYQCKAETAKIYYEDPCEAAKIFDIQGAEIIHIIDLDAAMGTGNNEQKILEIAENINAKIEVGGGIRELKDAEKYLNKNIERIIIGTSTFLKPKMIKKLVKDYGKERIVAAVDHFREEVKIKGWLESTNKNLFECLNYVEELKVGYILLSSIEGDGTLKGPDFNTIKEVSKLTNIPIIAAGGIKSIGDIIKLKSLNIYGVVIGKAFYENKFGFKEAINTLGGQIK